MENDIKKELEALDGYVDEFWRSQDKLDERVDLESITNHHKESFAEMLKGELGEDIKNVTSGKIKVKLPIKHRIKNWFKRFFKYFE